MDYNFIYNELSKTNVSDLTNSQINDMRDFILTVTSQVERNQTFDQIISRQLANVPSGLDTRTGSIIYDAIAPVSGELAQTYITLQIWKDQTYIMTATGEGLKRKGNEYGVPIKPATKAIRLGELIDTNGSFINLPEGQTYRFSVPESGATITFYIDGYQSTGHPILVCEQEGTQGNEYFGDILPLFNVSNLGIARIVGTIQPAQDEEEQETYRKRILERLNYKSFGGNIQDYIEYFDDKVDGVSKPVVFPVWDGGGTVKISVMDTQYNPITDEFKALIKEQIDPEEYTGQGLGQAPIGHKVTIDTPEKSVVDITANVSLDEGVEVEQIQSQIEEVLEDYFYEVRSSFADNVLYDTSGNATITLRIFEARINAQMFEVDNIINVTDIRLNGNSEDLEFISNAQRQYVPVLGSVVLTKVN